MTSILPPGRWPNGSSLALSIVVNVEEGAEMNVADGDRSPESVDELGITLTKPVRNYGNESNYQYGIKEGFGRIASLLDRYEFAATWTCAALALERAPHIAAFLAARGDEAASHGHRWVHQFRMDEDEERAFLLAAANSIEMSTGTRPAGHLSRYLLTPNTRRLLVELGFRYHMDDYSGDEPFWDMTDAGPIVIVPYAVDTNDMKFWNAPGYRPDDWLAYNIDTFDQLLREGREGDRRRMMSTGLHLRIIGRPGRVVALERFFEHVRTRMNEQNDVWITTRRAIASAFADSVPAPNSLK
jgi:allantoinase